MKMTIFSAAMRLLQDPRRHLATILEGAISSAATTVMHSLPAAHDLFDPRHSSVGGSVRRCTHLPGESDFDITVALKGAPWSGPYPDREFEPEVERSLTFYASRVGKELAKDHRVCDQLAQCYGGSAFTVVNCLMNTPQIKKWTGSPLLAAKFKLNGVTIVEIGLGHRAWHYVGLLYHDVWNAQLARLDPRKRDLAIAQILLAKLLVKQAKLYGDQNRLPNLTLNSRRLEQLVVLEALTGSHRPLADACHKVALLDDYSGLSDLMRHPAEAFPPGVTEAQLSMVCATGKSLSKWLVFRELAADVADQRIDFGAALGGP